MSAPRSAVARTIRSLKVFALFTFLSAASLMVGLMGCAGDRHSQSTRQGILDDRTSEHGYEQGADPRIEDSRTAERVREALAAGGDYKYDAVKVIAGDGVVRLSGFVDTTAQGKRAGEVASKVVGVNRVVNDLTVKD